MRLRRLFCRASVTLENILRTSNHENSGRSSTALLPGTLVPPETLHLAQSDLPYRSLRRIASSRMCADTVLSDAQKRAFIKDGYVVLPDVVNSGLVNAALDWTDLAYAEGKYSRVGASRQGSAVPVAVFDTPVKQSHKVTDLFFKTNLYLAVQELLGEGNASIRDNKAQIAYTDTDDLFVKQGMSMNAPIPKDDWHIDIGSGPFSPLSSDFFLLVGVALSHGQDVDKNHGQYIVWPGSHYITHPALSKVIFSNPTDEVTQIFRASKPGCGGPKRVLLRPGDAFISHQRLAHTAGPNLSKVTRKNVYFRVLHNKNKDFIYQRLQSLTPWVGFTGLQHLLPVGSVSTDPALDNSKMMRRLLAARAMGDKLPDDKRSKLSLSMKQKRQFMRDGYIVVQGVIDQDTVQAALAVIDEAIKLERFQVCPKREVGSGVRLTSFWKVTHREPAITKLFLKTGLVDLCEQLFGEGNVVLPRDPVQISVNDRNELLAAQNMKLKDAHPPHQWTMDVGLDQYVKHGTNCMLIVGVALSEKQDVDENRGQVVVWPRSHMRTHAHMRELHTKNADREEMLPKTWAGTVDCGAPKRLLLRPGDVFLAHQRLAHAAGINLTGMMRKNVHFRVSHADFNEFLEDYVSDITPFTGFNGLQNVMNSGETE